jgi:hypothetical protein
MLLEVVERNRKREEFIRNFNEEAAGIIARTSIPPIIVAYKIAQAVMHGRRMDPADPMSMVKALGFIGNRGTGPGHAELSAASARLLSSALKPNR